MADVTMPQLGETVTEGTITKWFKQVGDHGRRGRAAVRGLHRQGRHRGARRRSAVYVDRDPGARGRHGRRRHVIAVVGRRACRRRRRRRPAPRRAGPEAAAPPSRRAAAAARGGAGPGARAGRRPGRGRSPQPAAGPAPPPPGTRPRPSRPRRRAGAGAGDRRALLSPVVRRLVDEHGLDAVAITRHRPRRAHHP